VGREKKKNLLTRRVSGLGGRDLVQNGELGLHDPVGYSNTGSLAIPTVES